MKASLFIIVLIILSCENNVVNSDIDIYLKFKNTNEQLFTEQIKPLDIEENRADFIGIPTNVDYWIIYKIYNHGLNNYEQLNDKIEKTPEYTYVFSGKRNNKIILIIDKNNDKNFSNDERTIFQNLLGLSRSQITNSHELLKAPFYEINESDLKLKIFPFPNYYTSTSPEYAVRNELQIAITSTGYWYGEFPINNKVFKVALKKRFSKNKSQILFTKIQDSFYSILNEEYFPYNELDMLYLNGNNFLIEPLSTKNSILKLKYRGGSAFTGLHKGFYLENYPLKLINYDSKKNIDSLLQKKNYLLLDFWGTWCLPCIELIPEVKKINTDFENIQVLGIALDSSEELVANFIQNTDISYPNHFISFTEANDNYSIIQQQRISNYPYYILIDQNRKIIYRGFGKRALDKIKIAISQK